MLLALILLGTAISFTRPAPPGSPADACRAIHGAAVAQAKVPFAITGTTTESNATSDSVHMVQVGGQLYFQVDGTWRSKPHTTEDIIKDLNDKEKTAKQSCQRTGDAMVDGEAATIYQTHVTNGGVSSDNRYWICRRTGLPLKSESRIEGLTVNQTFHYAHVQAPPTANEGA